MYLLCIFIPISNNGPATLSWVYKVRSKNLHFFVLIQPTHIQLLYYKTVYSYTMCLGNRAEVSAHYINGQLRSLYENAQHCVEIHGTGLKPTASAVEYATCLYEFYGPGKRHQNARTDLAFFAKFGRPRLEFVCNHEVVLFLELVDGHYNLDYNKSTLKR